MPRDEVRAGAVRWMDPPDVAAALVSCTPALAPPILKAMSARCKPWTLNPGP